VASYPIGCPADPEEMAELYSEGSLSAHQTDTFEEHLLICVHCQTAVCNTTTSWAPCGLLRAKNAVSAQSPKHLLHAILRLCLGDSLPLHVARVVGTATFERRNVVYNVPGTCPSLLAGGWARMRSLELAPSCGTAPSRGNSATLCCRLVAALTSCRGTGLRSGHRRDNSQGGEKSFHE